MGRTTAQSTPSPRAVEALYATGHWLYSQQRIENAIAVFRAMIHIAPRDERGWLALGACHQAQGQDDVALEIYGTARAIAKATPRCDLARARILRTRGKDDEVRDAIDEAARAAEELHDDDLRLLVACERGQP